MSQRSVEDEEWLSSESNQSPITVVLVDKKDDEGNKVDGRLLFIQVGESSQYSQSAFVAYADVLKPHPNLPQDTQVLHQVATDWLTTCQTTHGMCGNLSMSTEKPTRLIEILDEDAVRLVETKGRSDIDGYVALSYCWGKDARKDDSILRGETRDHNYRARLRGFAVSELPQALRDSVKFIYWTGTKHLWIDAVCIIQQDNDHADFKREAPKMARVYGNATFTFSVASSKRATESLFRPGTGRTAWRLLTNNVELVKKIGNLAIPLSEAREHSPLAERGWTLQEEYLSPRRLYWFNHSLYWTCAEITCSEAGFKTTHGLDEGPKRPESFLAAIFQDDNRLLHEEWMRIVTSFVSRSIGERSDKFKAVAGVATRYYQPDLGEQYLAGLWRNTFAEELCWCLNKSMDWDKSFLDVAPSWSWASLPLESSISFQYDFKPSSTQDFELISADQGGASTSGAREGQNMPTDPIEHICAGEEVKRVQVKGPLRKLWTTDSKIVPWEDVHDQNERFLFNEHSGSAVRCVNAATGKLATAAAHKQPVYCQLDYVQHGKRLIGDEIDLFCLRIGETAMLLLEKLSAVDYRRVGFSDGFGPNFFATTSEEALMLV